MATRSAQNQNFHDQVVRLAASYLDKNKYSVYSNPNGETNTKVGEHYPDIIVTNKGDNKALFIIEVETQDSITITEATTQWSAFQNLGGTFYLLVPRDSVETAQNLCQTCGVKAKMAHYWVENGTLKVLYK
jgi:hypothetical protein